MVNSQRERFKPCLASSSQSRELYGSSLRGFFRLNLLILLVLYIKYPFSIVSYCLVLFDLEIMRKETLVPKTTRVVLWESFANVSLLFFLQFAARHAFALRMIKSAFISAMTTTSKKIVANFNHVPLSFSIDAHQMPFAGAMLIQLALAREGLVAKLTSNKLLAICYTSIMFKRGAMSFEIL